MIAQRFRALGWVAGFSTAATALYLVSLQVAAERAKLEAVENQIARAQRDMRQLQTELGTRASMRQLEKWNGEVLSLSAPKAVQFLQGEAQLASLGQRMMEVSPTVPPVALAAAAPKQEPPAASESPQLQRASYTPLPTARTESSTSEDMLGHATLAQMSRAARHAARARR